MREYAVIMAGGSGTRFWPLSRIGRPKQYLNLTGNELLINETIDRLNHLFPLDQIMAVTGASQEDILRQTTEGRIRPDNVLIEPFARNTTACIGLAATVLKHRHGDAIMCILPADHYIREDEEFRAVLRRAMDLADSENCIVTIGIEPTFPATGYGYMKHSGDEVIKFVEKPVRETAEKYLKEGGYLWNSGMFVWKTSVILEQYRRLMPAVYESLMRLEAQMDSDTYEEVLSEVYQSIPKISVDYAIMERAGNVRVIPATFTWNDIGTWDSLDSLYEKDEQNNISVGPHVHMGTRNSMTYSQGRLIATIGLSHIGVVETEDAVLVFDRDHAQEVGSLWESIKKAGLSKYLEQVDAED